MHHAAEYGDASHWMYKDDMKDASQATAATASEPTATSGPRLSGKDYRQRVTVGQPALVVDEGRIRDAVVLHVSQDGRPAVLAATTRRSRWHAANSVSAPMQQAEYSAMLEHAEAAGWSEAGQHDKVMRVRHFALLSDGSHVGVDHLGVANRDCTLTFVSPSPEAAAAPVSPPAAPADEQGDAPTWPRFRLARLAARKRLDADKVVQLRAVLEWGAEAAAADAAAAEAQPRRRQMPSSKQELYQMSNAGGLVSRLRQQAAALSPEMTVLVEPGGLRTVPRGATARDVVQEFGRIELSGCPPSSRVVNVNNVLVPEDTLLHPGDLVVLSNHVLADV